MGAVAYDLQPQDEKHVEIVIHVDESLEEHERKDLVDALVARNAGWVALPSGQWCVVRPDLLAERANLGGGATDPAHGIKVGRLTETGI